MGGWGREPHEGGMNDIASPLAPSRRRTAVSLIAPRELATLDRGKIRVPDPNRVVHLQLRRFAGCPICSLHLRSFAKRHGEIVAAGVVEVAVFHSRAEDLRLVHSHLPFAVVPDPDKHLYTQLGVGTSPRALLDPRAWPAVARALATHASPQPNAGHSDGSFGLPGDFLIARDGRIFAHKYGRHADDQWSVDEMLAYVREYAGAR